MKYKSILIVFNVIIILFLILVFLVPVFLLGFDFFKIFWSSAWPLAALLILIILGMNGYFFYNHRFFSLLEREDWPAMALFLENKVISQGHYSSRLVQLLANTYLVLADPEAVIRLESRVAAAKPLLLETHGLIFGAARILGKNFPAAARFFQDRLAKTGDTRTAKKGNVQWLSWYYGFSQLLDRRYQEAANCFLGIALTIEGKKEKGGGNEIIPVGLAAYFLSETLRRLLPRRRDELIAAASGGRDQVLAILPTQAAWDRQIGKIQTEAHIAVLAKYVKDAAQWLYQGVRV